MTTAALLITIGRVVFGAFFIIAGIRNTLNFKERRVMKTNFGWTLPAPLAAIGIAIQFLGGISVLLGLWTVAGALALIVFLIPATLLFHNFLMFSGKERAPHLYLTLVNTTLVGCLLMIIGNAL
ncbi:MAG TPA: DoxX family protein [Arsenicitalea sp.]|jgi:putative oxidoreductase|nr:DoxX family protein [Arsenicitalea sp.]